MGFKTIIKPSKEKVIEHYRKISEIVDRHKAVQQHILISKLNPVIRGWSNYYRTACSKETFSKISHLLHHKLWVWGKRRHPNKNKGWVKNKYWHPLDGDNWTFGVKYEDYIHPLIKHSKTPIIRHTKVKGTASPYDGNFTSWATRMGKHPEVKTIVAKLLKKQKGICNLCKLNFTTEDKIEIDHITPSKAGGVNSYENLQVLHKHCHDKKTNTDLNKIKRYKIRKGWAKVYKKFHIQFEKSEWKWKDDLPTRV